MQTVLHKAHDRGSAYHDRLETYHSFSFANYYNPEMMGFGVLRVLNDDTIDPEMGFGMHPHDNMEIITIPVEGALRHKDNIGGGGVIGVNDVQIMSAGTGVIHSEFNASNTEPVKLLQIWIIPDTVGVVPRYDQKTFPLAARRDQFQLVVSPDGRNGSLMIHQNAFVSRVFLDEEVSLTYKLYDHDNGVYIFVLGGIGVIAGHEVEKKDAVGVTHTGHIDIQAATSLELLILELPMQT